MGVGDLAAILAVATGITKIVDFIRLRFDKAGLAPKDLWVALALGLGVAFALGAKANLLADVDWAASVGVLTGRIVTGVAIGGAASGSHELLDWLSGGAKAKHALAITQDAGGPVVPDAGGAGNETFPPEK